MLPFLRRYNLAAGKLWYRRRSILRPKNSEQFAFKSIVVVHCEERSDEAIQRSAHGFGWLPPRIKSKGSNPCDAGYSAALDRRVASLLGMTIPFECNLLPSGRRRRGRCCSGRS
jgi:hypothetical protein